MKMPARLPGLFVSLAVALCATSAIGASEQTNRVSEISVTGTGNSEAAPDLAIVTLTVSRESETARTALTDNNQAMARVLAAMKESGIAERDLQTAGFAITPRIVYPKRGDTQEVPRTVGYTVSNALTIRIRDLDTVGAILDKSVSLGVNQGGQLTFTNVDTAQYTRLARQRAVADAIQKAETLTVAAGAKLGRLLSISEQSGHGRPIMMMRGAVNSDAAEANVPIASGENTYSVTVNISWEIAQ